MPTITGDFVLEEDGQAGDVIQVTVEFEAYCSCGNGICGNVDTGKTPRRRYPFINVQPCKKCLDAALEDGEDRREVTVVLLREQIEKLEARIEELERQIGELESQL